MNKYIKQLCFVPTVLISAALLSLPALAVSEAEVEAAVSASGKHAVSGNILIWFLCAVAFLKVSQKIDSFISGLGVPVGNTGSSMLAEAMVAVRGFSLATGILGGVLQRGAAGAAGAAAASGTAGTFTGGLAGMIGRTLSGGAAKSVSSAAPSAGAAGASAFSGVGGALFAKSIRSGGSFANNVIGAVARGDPRTAGTMTGELAGQALNSYMGFTALGEDAKDVPSFSDVEIGGGRITGTETAPGAEEGISFGMYHADQYERPQGEFTTVHSADGAKWYKQYAQDTVERKPYVAPDNTIAYRENIVKKLPNTPRRKGRQ